MSSDTICKIVHQYNKNPVSKENMQKLQEIASDYAAVKNYVYQRYGGVKSLSKLYPGYTVQNEMTKSGLRERLGLPSVYFYLAVFDALAEIKSQWTRTKTKVAETVKENRELTEEEQHFLRYLLKVNNAFDAALNGTVLELPKEIRQQYDKLASQVTVKKLEHYLGRQVRKHHKKPHTDKVEGFAISERAYRYADHGIYIAIKEKRKRIFILLTDKNCYTRQLYIRLFPEESRMELNVPIDCSIKRHEDYEEALGISMGMRTMITTDQGRIYGEKFGICQSHLSDWIREQSTMYSKNKGANPGRKKYYAKKQRLEEQFHSYINQELNRFLKEEKPEIIYLPKFPKPGTAGPVKRMNHYATMWQRGYLRERLTLKCREQSVQLIEVFGKDISRECSQCGAMGEKKGERFFCPQCGYEADQKENSARNAKKRGEEQTTRMTWES